MDRNADEQSEAGERERQSEFKNFSGAGFSLLDPPRRMGSHRTGIYLFNILLLVTFTTCIILFTVTLIKYSELSEELKRGRPSALNHSELLEELKRWQPSAINYSEILEELKRHRPSSFNYSQLLEELKTWQPSQLNFSQDLVASLVKASEDLKKLLGDMCKPCPAGWVNFNGTCYLFSDFKLSYHLAEQDCLKRDSHLVIINNRAEQNFLQRYTNYKGHWIGLSDAASEGRWHWVDGSPLTFTNWNVGEPNDGGNQEDCAEMLAIGLWNDIPCTHTFNFMCEKMNPC